MTWNDALVPACRVRRWAACACVFGMIVAAAPSLAASTPWVFAGGGTTALGLDAVTDAPTTYRGYAVEPGSMDSGSMVTAAVGVDLAEAWSFGFAYERCGASTRGVSATSAITIDMPLQVFTVQPSWYPVTRSAYRLGVGAAVGVGYVEGTSLITGGLLSGMSGDVSAITLALEARLLAEVRPLRTLGVVVAAGLRQVTFDDVQVIAATLKRDDNGEPVSFDYGGAFVQVGIRWQIPASEPGL